MRNRERIEAPVRSVESRAGSSIRQRGVWASFGGQTADLGGV